MNQFISCTTLSITISESIRKFGDKVSYCIYVISIINNNLACKEETDVYSKRLKGHSCGHR